MKNSVRLPKQDSNSILAFYRVLIGFISSEGHSTWINVDFGKSILSHFRGSRSVFCSKFEAREFSRLPTFEMKSFNVAANNGFLFLESSSVEVGLKQKSLRSIEPKTKDSKTSLRKKEHSRLSRSWTIFAEWIHFRHFFERVIIPQIGCTIVLSKKHNW